MTYKYFRPQNYEDFAGGRIIYHKPGFTNYPVRLAGEIFMRCLEALGRQDKICLYDPCCGSGYILTVLGFLCGSHISSLIGSDISGNALELAEKNLSLLTPKGLDRRKSELLSLYKEYGKESHAGALIGAANLQALLDPNKPPPSHTLFKADILATSPDSATLRADIVITDIPYGHLAVWQTGTESPSSEPPLHRLLGSLIPVLNPGAIVAVSGDKRQKANHEGFKRIEMFNAGKRRIEILRF